MVLVDTNVILDVVTGDSRWSDSSRRQLVHWLDTGPVVINAIIYGKIGFACERIESLDALLTPSLRLPGHPEGGRLSRRPWRRCHSMGPDPMSQGFAGGWLGPVWWSGLQLTHHAADKLETYGIDGARLESWRAALDSGDPFLDVVTGSLVLVIHWEERPWIVILSEDGTRVVTTYPSDERTVINRRGAGRWIYPAN